MKRVLVTGGSGFIGASLTRRLLRDGNETHLILRPAHQQWRLREIAGQVQMHLFDLEDSAAVLRCVQEVRPEWVFHLAAYGAYSGQTGIERMIATNLLGTVELLNACVEVGVEAFVQTGSSSEYGYKDHPAREDEAIHPNSHYAITKAAATYCCQFSAAQQRMNAITVRLYSIYGPYEEPARLIPSLVVHGLRGLLPALVSPLVARDFVYVDEAVEAIVRVATDGRAGKVYNVCSGIQSTLQTVVDTARSVMKIPAEPVWAGMPERSWDTNTWCGSPELMAREVGWQARKDFRTGLQDTIDWMTGHPEWRAFYDARIFGTEKMQNK